MLQIELIIDGAAKEIAKSGLAKEEHAATLDSAASETAGAPRGSCLPLPLP